MSRRKYDTPEESRRKLEEAFKKLNEDLYRRIAAILKESE